MLSNPQYATLLCVIYIVENLPKGMWFFFGGGGVDLINIMHNIIAYYVFMNVAVA